MYYLLTKLIVEKWLEKGIRGEFEIDKVGKEGLEPSRLAAHDPKSCLSANSSISPGCSGIISVRQMNVNNRI